MRMLLKNKDQEDKNFRTLQAKLKGLIIDVQVNGEVPEAKRKLMVIESDKNEDKIG